MRRALVTGATGFIGSRLAGALLERGVTVRALARDVRRAAELGPVEVHHADLLDEAALEGIERGVDVVVHCASLLGKWGTDEQRLHELNAEAPVRLLERFRGSGLTRFVHVSAGGVTGPVRGNAADERYDCRPATGYERTKLAGERAVLERAREWNLPATVIRPTFTYGPGDPHKVALFRAVRRGRYVFIDGGRSVNHPAFIDDVVRGLLLGIERGRDGETYIVGGERPVSKRELVFSIADALGVRRPSLSIPRALAWPAAATLETVGRIAGFEPILTRSRVMMMADDFGYTIAKARAELGYEPRVGLDDGIRATVADYVDRGVL